MRDDRPFAKSLIFPTVVALTALSCWSIVCSLRLFSGAALPSPMEVFAGFREEVSSGRLMADLIASLYRVGLGVVLGIVAAIPLGLWLGHHRWARIALMPAVNFFRSLSPLAWIPFAILWFGIGDAPVIFLIFMPTFFTLTLATAAAVANIPAVYFRVAGDYGIQGTELLWVVTFPAALPQIITALRLTAGIAWMVVVAAEMVSGRDGLGFGVWDARNGQRADLLVCYMIVIGVIGVTLDRLLQYLTGLPSVRWGYER
jgi:NitT/TauT family transport system permease protein